VPKSPDARDDDCESRPARRSASNEGRGARGAQEKKSSHPVNIERLRKILACVSIDKTAEPKTLAEDLDVSVSTINRDLEIMEEKEILFKNKWSIGDRIKEGQFKCFIFIETEYTKDKKEVNYQIGLVDEIRKRMKGRPYLGKLFLVSIDIVMGAKFDIILVVRSDDPHHLGMFVKSFLRTHPWVQGTQTILAWPSKGLDLLAHELGAHLVEEPVTRSSETAEPEQE
jgi:DNA-binding Lrp family transcriptional regulator